MWIMILIKPSTNDATARTRTTRLNAFATPALLTTCPCISHNINSLITVKRDTYPENIDTVVHLTSPSGVSRTLPRIFELAFGSQDASMERDFPVK